MDELGREGIMLSKSDIDKYCITCMWNVKYNKLLNITKEKDSQIYRTN